MVELLSQQINLMDVGERTWNLAGSGFIDKDEARNDDQDRQKCSLRKEPAQSLRSN